MLRNDDGESGDDAMFLRRTGIHEGVTLFRNTPGAVLLDVRDAEEYIQGHIPGAVNLPLENLDRLAAPKEKPVFVYCLRGMRSRRAVRMLKRQGYTDVRSIGGIMQYNGPVESGNGNRKDQK